jgi:hypothetical protein
LPEVLKEIQILRESLLSAKQRISSIEKIHEEDRKQRVLSTSIFFPHLSPAPLPFLLFFAFRIFTNEKFRSWKRKR